MLAPKQNPMQLIGCTCVTILSCSYYSLVPNLDHEDNGEDDSRHYYYKGNALSLDLLVMLIKILGCSAGITKNIDLSWAFSNRTLISEHISSDVVID